MISRWTICLLLGPLVFLLRTDPLGAATATTTQTTLQVSSQSTSFGTVYTLLANVSVGGVIPVVPGQVVFQDEGAPGACTPVTGTPTGCHLLGTAQLSGTGQAKLAIRLGAGQHSLFARFLGTKSYVVSMQSYAPSVSGDTSVSVMGTPTVTVTSFGSAGDYTLTGTVVNKGFLTPTDSVNFIDQSNPNPNFHLGTAPLGAGILAETFGSLGPYQVGALPQSVAVGDFNGDGVPDLVTANFIDDSVSVLLGKGDGTFQSQRTYSVGDSPISVAVGDFNGDGMLDLAETSLAEHTLSVFLGNGDGSFQPQQTYTVGYGPYVVAVGDFNGDGILDVVTADGFQAAVSVLLGKGDGSFLPQQIYDVGNLPRSVAVGDFNGDGVPDLVTNNSDDNTVSVLLGKGDGKFQSQTTYNVGSSPSSVAIEDFNGDGIPDLVTTNLDSENVSVLLGNGNGKFQSQTTYNVGSFPWSVAIGDFNGDGIPDLVTANNDGVTVSVLLGKGDGTFQPQQTYDVGDAPTLIAVGDFNGDGVPDLVTANSGDNTVSVLLNQVQQTASATLRNVSVFGGGTHNIAAQYSGDTYFASVTSSPVSLVGSPIPTNLALTAIPNSGVTTAQPVTLTVSLTPLSAYNYTATGAVTFYDNGAVLSSVVLVNGGATLRTTLPAGNNTLTAIYSGDLDFGSSNSNTIAVTVAQAASFTIAALPPAETVYRGRVAGFFLELTSVNDFQGSVQLSCAGGPSGSRCSDLPRTVYLNGTAYALSGILFPRNTAPGTYTVTFTVVSGSLTASTTATFKVR